MEYILVLLIVALLNGAIAYIDGLMEGIIPLTLYAEQYMSTLAGVDLFQSLFDIVFGFGVSLIVLKFLKKGFETYVLWSDGDADEDPIAILTNFFKAMAVAICFPTMYDWLATIVEEMSNKMLEAIGLATAYDWAGWVSGISSMGLVTAIFGLVFVIVYFILYFQFLMRGLEILILRVGIPLACVGLIDNDKGVFKPYMSKFFQSALSVVIQVSLLHVDSEIEKLVDSLTGANNVLLSYVNVKIAELDGRKQELVKQIAELTVETISPGQVNQISGYLDTWDDVSFDDKRRVVDLMITTVAATSDSLNITWKI